MVVAGSATLVLALALQLLALRHGAHGSISDLPHVFLHRGIRPGTLPYLDRPIEYPVVAGFLLYAASLVWASPVGVLLVTAVAASALFLTVTALLARRFGARAWRWAIATPIMLYAFQNWDLFAIAALVVGLLAFERRRDGTAGVAFGVGGAIKLFPLVVVPPLAVYRWTRGDRRGAQRLLAAGAATFALLNLPIAAINRSGWWWPYAFQSRRDPTWGTAWFYGFRALGLPIHGPAGAHLATIVSATALVGGMAWLLAITVHRRLDPFGAAAAAVAIFVLCNKVYSPTYDVWLVAFFVMLPLSRRLWVSFCAVDAAVFVTVYGFFAGIDSIGFVRAVLPLLVLVRTGVLLTLIRRATASPIDTTAPTVVPRTARLGEGHAVDQSGSRL
jgi:Glycosyltransferase family 87